MDTELTDDEHLRALAALEAVIGNNDKGLATLTGNADERPLPELLAVYGRHTLERILLAAFGITQATDDADIKHLVAQLNTEPQARLTFLLADALRQQAELAGHDLATAKRIGISILGAIAAFTDADDSDAVALLRGLRGEVLRAS